MKIHDKRISIFILVALIGIVMVGLGLVAFSLIFRITDRQVSNPIIDVPQPLRGTITQGERGKDGVQVKLKTEYGLYSVTINMMQTEIIGSFDQIKVGAEIEVLGQGVAEMDSPLIVAEHVTVLGSSTHLTGETWVLTTYNDQQPIAGHQPILQFETEQVSGMTGCNHYGGSYQTNRDEISFDGLYSTEMACMDPAGVMEQERTYLELLGTAQRFELVDGVLTIYTGSGNKMIFESQQDSPDLSTPVIEQPSPIPPMQTVKVTEPTPLPTSKPPDGFTEYRDSIIGISIYIPESWFATGVIEGQYAIFQSYPEDKYVGGEGRESGDTKCDLNIRTLGTSVDELIQQWESNPRTTIVSREEVTLISGLIGQQLVLENMGRAVALVAEINNRAITLICFGDPEPFEDIAQTLREVEPDVVSPIYDSEEGFHHYKDTETDVAIDMPGNWIVTGIVPGERVTLQSYPENKHIGGEALEPGDTKCELFIRKDIRADGFISQMKSNEAITIITEEQMILHSGQTGTRIELDSLGRSILVITEINGSTVVLICYGDFVFVDMIAATLKGAE